MESGEVDGRVVFDRCLQVGRQHGLAMIALRTAHHAGKVEIETQLVAVAQFERRNQQATVIGTGIAGQHRQADFLQALLAVAAHQREAGDELVVDRHAQPRLIAAKRRRVAVAQVQRNTLVAPDEQIRRQVEVDRDRLRRHAVGMQLLRIVEQFSQADGAVGAHPVRCVVRLARGQWLDLIDTDLAAAEQHVAGRHRSHGLLQVVIVAAQHQQQLSLRILRQRHQFDHRALHRSMVGDHRREPAVDRQHHRVALVRQRAETDRETCLAPPAGQAAEVRGHHRRRPLLCQARRSGEHHWQFQPCCITRIEERQREVGQVVLHRQRLAAQAQRAVAGEIDPQRAVRRLFADVGVVADELQADLVEISNQARVQR